MLGCMLFVLLGIAMHPGDIHLSNGNCYIRHEGCDVRYVELITNLPSICSEDSNAGGCGAGGSFIILDLKCTPIQ